MASSLLPWGKVPLQICRLSYCSYPHHLEFIFCPQSYSKRIIHEKPNSKETLVFGLSACHYQLKPATALNSEESHPTNQENQTQEPSTLRRGENFEQWDSMTAKFAGAANVPFLLLQLPQIILNARNLQAGNKSALLAVPWLGMFTGLLGNLSLMSYFIKKRETEAVVVQTLGVVSIFVVMLQLAMAEAMPLPHFIATSIVVMWSTFVPYVPNTILPGVISFSTAVLAVLMARIGKLSDQGTKFLGSVSSWCATLLFMWMPVAQMWTNLLNPDNIRGLSAVTMLLAMIGNGFMIPRALFIRDFMWFTGSSWGCIFYGLGNLICMYCFNSISKEFFLAATLGFIAWIGITLWRDSQAYGYSSPLTSLKELVFGP
ncbi:maltose excess protein 1-like, chloroplastic isoform X2 [Olea europaea var. sylvestris]|uniref:maltose excess protein 1-like, chloroplastic isoform X2 n=1 Tax=Olea europaea var. sylvestris TaxID=158386 RepID=UPI000C1D4FEA|nr:maltose excess protein 1-like, chloroplastic isoform X2 [Olea europaea var. sylvestris]